MRGHLVSFLICLCVGHRDLKWRVGPYGLGWECDRCLRMTKSAAVRVVQR